MVPTYEMKFDLYEGTLSGVLKSRVELSLPMPDVPPSILLSPIEGTPTLVRIFLFLIIIIYNLFINIVLFDLINIQKL